MASLLLTLTLTPNLTNLCKKRGACSYPRLKIEKNITNFSISGGQKAAAAVPKGEGTEEVEEYDYQYYDETKPDSPFVNPHDPTHQKPELLAGNLAGHLAGIFANAPTTTTPRPSGPTTSPPLRIFPNGNVQLERFPEGFNFAFRSD